MKTRNRFLTTIVLAMACLMLAIPGMASNVVYDNGKLGNGEDAWTINYGWSVRDTFYLGAPTQITGVVFYVWEFPGDTMYSVHWQISGGPNLGAVLPMGTADITGHHQGLLLDTLVGQPPPYGYDIDRITLVLPSFNLPPGTYWLTLSKATASNNDPVYWDQNDGAGCTGWRGLGCPPTAREDAIGTIPSETFLILGN